MELFSSRPRLHLLPLYRRLGVERKRRHAATAAAWQHGRGDRHLSGDGHLACHLAPHL